ncbi:44394_t:CDS:2 [Gigaspora margarita]|uniref:44394_t:CDS:1 n=1 Tax=Gigaspora margarita TaxID=4874 RepID=A0ABN7V0G9_GIGMA|nr:44394_t:CDS:2 [Gigaspora margarita]
MKREAKRILDDTDSENPKIRKSINVNFLNLKIALPTRKKLSGKVLNKAITEFISKIEKLPKKICSERARPQDVIFKIEELFSDLELKKIKLW